MIGYGGGVNAGQKSPGLSVAGHVRSARRPPEFVIAKSVVVRRAHRVGHDVADERLARAGRPALPQVSARGIAPSTTPITVLKIGASCAFSSSIRAWIAGSGVTPIVHGLWKSAVL